jgi:hypothetical protein
MNVIITELLSSMDIGFNPAMQIIKESFVKDERDRVSYFRKSIEKKIFRKT